MTATDVKNNNDLLIRIIQKPAAANSATNQDRKSSNRPTKRTARISDPSKEIKGPVLILQDFIRFLVQDIHLGLLVGPL